MASIDNLGLTTFKAQQQLKISGLNRLPDKSGVKFLNLLFSQFKNFLTLILILAILLSFLIGDQIDGVLILIILFLNVGLGFWQEYKASKELQALRKLVVSTSRVIRDGVQKEISSLEIVPEDIIVLESGDKIPADGILIESFNLSVNESALTGESFSVIKAASTEDNIVYFGTIVTGGRAKMKVTSTGTNTKFGKIALTLSKVEEEQTPLEISLNNLAKKIAALAMFIAVFVFTLRIIQGQQVLEVLLSSIALLVAAVPEGLPSVITVILALSVRRIYQKKTLVRKMSAIESLGSVDVICTDKTGTLTKNEMSVKEVICDKSNLSLAIKTSVICNSASLVSKEDHGSFDILGDTTEGALLIWADKKGIDINSMRSEGEILEEIPFDLKRKMMTVVWKEKDHISVYSKGAPESIFPLCNLSEKKLDELDKEFKRLASKGLRVLAIASKSYAKNKTGGNIEKDLNFLGLVGIADAPRVEAAEAILKANRAGIKVVMITGDSELTAKIIAEEVGLLKEGDEIFTGAQLCELSDEELIIKLQKISFFARVLPEHKLRIVQVYQKSGKVVAVTGDGVNDSLALKQANVGVAMGITGTDVAKEAADIVILDDNLSTIISAIEQGRVVYNNILKVVKFLMAGNLSEVLIIVVIALFGYPNPLLAIQLLWINFVTDGLPALSLAADSASGNAMSIPPRNKTQSMLSFYNLRFILICGSLIALINILIFMYLFHFYNLQIARSALFTSIVVSQMAFVLLMRRHHTVTSNKYLFWSVGLVLLMQGLILILPQLRTIFKL